MPRAVQLSSPVNFQETPMKTIDTLVEDIEKIFQLPHEFDEDRFERFAQRVKESVRHKINPPELDGSLRFSNVGTKCERKLWYGVNASGERKALPTSARIKFLYGDVLECLLLFLAEEAGHSVTGCQTELRIGEVKGHRDAVIDGVVVDCKSASTFSFNKFKKGLTYAEDEFGYIDQLQAYLYASQDDDLVTDKSRAAFLVIDKTLGHICLDIHKKMDTDYSKVFSRKKDLVESEVVPPRGFEDEPEGASGNRKLSMFCSYCDFKEKCYPNLRTFLYSNKPVHLTKVVREPKVLEVKYA